MVGSFGGWMRANDAVNIVKEDGDERIFPNGIMHCCTANGARTLYYVWDSIVTGDAQLARVNLLLNRASELLDVNSYLPALGKVTLKIKRAREVAVRMPEWVDLGRVQLWVANKKKDHEIDGRYIVATDLQSGDEVTLEFPVPERTIHRVIGRRPYKLTLRGSNVVEIDPPGVVYPLYRDQPKGKLIPKTRFIPATKVTW
jgi:hypothetical protein